MRGVLIFHGTGGNPQGNWFPWLKEELVVQCSPLGWIRKAPALLKK